MTITGPWSDSFPGHGAATLEQRLCAWNCPISGRNLPIDGVRGRTLGVVPVDAALVDHLVAGTGLTPAEAQRVVEDVVAFHAEPVEDYVRRRHAELKTYGAKNAEIFARIAAELAEPRGRGARSSASASCAGSSTDSHRETRRPTCAGSSGTSAASRPRRCCSRA